MIVRNTGFSRFGLRRAYGGLADSTDFAFKTFAAVVVGFALLVQRSAGAHFFLVRVEATIRAHLFPVLIRKHPAAYQGSEALIDVRA